MCSAQWIPQLYLAARFVSLDTFVGLFSRITPWFVPMPVPFAALNPRDTVVSLPKITIENYYLVNQGHFEKRDWAEELLWFFFFFLRQGGNSLFTTLKSPIMFPTLGLDCPLFSAGLGMRVALHPYSDPSVSWGGRFFPFSSSPRCGADAPEHRFCHGPAWHGQHNGPDGMGLFTLRAAGWSCPLGF